MFFCKISDTQLTLKTYAAKENLKKSGIYPRSIKVVQLNYWLPCKLALQDLQR